MHTQKIYFSKKFAEVILSDFISNIPEHEDAVPETEGAVILSAIEVQHGIVVQRAKNIYTFSHLTLQEYFVAKYIENHKSSLQDLSEILRNSLTNVRWREVFIILSEMLADAGEYLKYIQELNSTIVTSNVRQLLSVINSIVDSDVTEGIPNYYRKAVLLLWFLKSSKLQQELYIIIDLLKESSRNSLVPYLSPPGTKNILHGTLENTFNEIIKETQNISLTKEDEDCLHSYFHGIDIIVQSLLSSAYIEKEQRNLIINELFKSP